MALVIDAKRGLDQSLDPLLKHLPEVRRPIIAVLNKIDQVSKPELLRLATEVSAIRPFDRTFMLSALTGSGVADLKAYLVGAVPPGPWLFPEDQLTDAPLRQAAAEITREKLFVRLHDELPYTLTVETAGLEGAQGRQHPHRADDLCGAREPAQDRARRQGRHHQEDLDGGAEDIAAMAEAQVHLFLFVKVRERWGDDPERYREMGLDYPKK